MLNYITTNAKEAREDYGADIGHWIDDWTGILLRNENGIITTVHIDGGEPEDQCLGRDLDTFVSELRRCAKEINTGKNLLRELAALVWGGCPSLLHEDSGGDVELACNIEEFIKEDNNT